MKCKSIFSANIFTGAFMLASIGGMFSSSANEAIQVQEIVAKASHASYYQGKSGRAKVQMTIEDKQKNQRIKKFTILREDIKNDVDEGQKFYIYFTYPSDERGTSFLVWKHLSKADDRWLYLPGLDLVKPIAASDERSSFVGSDFLYEDVSGRIPSEDQHELVKTTDNFYVVQSTPIDASKVEFSSYKSWIHKQSFLPVKSEFYDKNGKAYRVYEATKVETIASYPTVVESKMTNLVQGSHTLLKYMDVKYDIEFKENIFTEKYVRTPPRAYLK
ncbi:MAG: outer membrane lipoprotein-sorting protein [Bdellovibrionales bacterium]|nr:outer membrane lipoprotein-sorting protein [Bdellovibrionales bacterium]